MFKILLVFLVTPFVIVILFAHFFLDSYTPSLNHGNSFSQVGDPAFDDNNIFDIGVVDFNSDDRIDIFTSSHHSRASLLKNTGDNAFENVLSSLKLDQQKEYPALEIQKSKPELSKHGLYFYWSNDGFVIFWNPSNDMSPVQITLDIPSAVSIYKSDNGITTNIDTDKNKSGLTLSSVIIDAKSKGSVVLNLRHIAIPIEIDIDGEIDTNRIYVGHKLTNPGQAEFSLKSRNKHNLFFFINDRHGVAWTDLNNDKVLDLYITRGGLRGEMYKFDYSFKDELFVSSQSRYKNLIQSTLIDKGACPGYNVQWVDYDIDGLLDIYIACHHKQENQLHRNNGDGTYTDVAKDVGLDFVYKSTDMPFVWMDIDNDLDPDLLIASNEGVHVYRNSINEFELLSTHAVTGISKLLPADYDKDNDIDLIAVSYTGNTAILKNTNGEFSKIKSSDYGLPASSITASWVDYDSDGLLDYYAVPGGIYKQNKKGEFVATGLLKHRLPMFVKRARAQWFDADNDGDMDLLLATNYETQNDIKLAERLFGSIIPDSLKSKRNWKWHIRLFKNNITREEDNWLQIQLAGDESNPQAIGSRLTVKSAQESVAYQVGQFDTSLVSQGHYRLYHAFDSTSKAEEIEIHWPDGSRQIEPITQTGKLLKIQKTSGLSN